MSTSPTENYTGCKPKVYLLKMRFRTSLLIAVTALLIMAAHTQATALDSTFSLVESPVVQDTRIAYPSDLISDFPDVKWGISFQEVKAVIAKTGASPAGFNNNEIVWDGKFNGTQGRATVLLKDNKVNQISIVFYAGPKRAEIYTDLLKRATANYGKMSEEVKDTDSISGLWKPSNDITVELRNITDPDSPVVVIQWVHG